MLELSRWVSRWCGDSWPLKDRTPRRQNKWLTRIVDSWQVLHQFENKEIWRRDGRRCDRKRRHAQQQVWGWRCPGVLSPEEAVFSAPRARFYQRAWFWWDNFEWYYIVCVSSNNVFDPPWLSSVIWPIVLKGRRYRLTKQISLPINYAVHSISSFCNHFLVITIMQLNWFFILVISFVISFYRIKFRSFFCKIRDIVVLIFFDRFLFFICLNNKTYENK